MDIPQLAAEVAKFLAPFLPYLILGTEAAAKEAGKRFGGAMWDKAVELWDRLKPKVEASLDAQKMLERTAEKPEDKRVGILEMQFEDMFYDNPAFAMEVRQIIQVGDGSMFVNGGMTDSVATFGSGNLVANKGGQIHQTINNFVQYDKNSDPKILESQLVNYLKWVKDYFEFIELRGIEQGESPVIRLKLDEVYIPLQAEPWREAEQMDEHMLRAREKGKSIKAPSRAESERVRLDQLLAGERTRIIITGGPGCGKTTVLQHIAWSLAQGWLENSDFAKKKLGIKTPYPLPIYVPLNLYAKHLRDFAHAPAKKRTLAGFISEYLVLNMVGPEINSDFFAFLLQEKNSVLLLLDGLDEVPTEDERIQVRNDIEKLISGKKDLLMVVTSRTAAYKGKAMLGHDFQHIRVLPLQAEQIESMVRKAYNYRFVNSPTRAKKSAGDLLEGIQRLEQERQKRLGETAEPLVDSPLMVRMMLVVAANNRVLPNQRADLYDKTVNAMLRPENILDEKVAEDISRRVGGGVSIHREMLQTLAFHLHQRGENQGKDIEEQALRDILEPMPAYAPHIDDLLQLARARGGVLDFRGGSFRFLHLSFQEFLVGRYLAEQMRDIEKISQFIEKDKVLDSWWREPILLLCGYLDINASSPARALLQRLSGLDENAKGRNHELTQDIQLASAEIASAALLEFQQAIPDLAEQLANRLVELIEEKTPSDPKLRAEAGNTLAKLGDPRFDEARWQLPKEALLGFAHIPAGGFLMGTKKKDIKALIEKFGGNEDYYKDETEQHKLHLPDYFIARYPVTAAQFKAFVEASKHKPANEASLQGVPNHPVRYVTWFDALAYCNWLNEKLKEIAPAQKPENETEEVFWQGIGSGKLIVTLPSEAEWEKAARGGLALTPNPSPTGRGESRLFPWGDAITPDHANYGDTNLNTTSAVGAFPQGESSYGLQDMSGNVWEWTRSIYDKYPYEISEKRENLEDKKSHRVLRGGAFSYEVRYVRCAYRSRYYPNLGDDFVGFRGVVVSHFS
jgi:formylglycine-generating enzyme required for sulfatase activity